MSTSSSDVPAWARELGLASRMVAAPDGTRLRVFTGGAPAGARAILLHGFPQHAGAWQHVARELAPTTYLVIPDLRGYGASELAASGRYDLATLAADVLAVEAATRRVDDAPGSALLIAHDWGGPIAWAVLHHHPERVRGLVATNAPHFAAYARSLATREQAWRSWYTAVFQVPHVEHLLTAGDGRVLRMVFETSSPGVFSPAAIEEFVGPLLRPGRTRAALSYYREAARTLARDRRAVLDLPPTSVPAMIVWGQDDAALARSHPDACRAYASNLEIRRLDGVGHWVPEQAPGEVARALADLDARTR